ncbi:MAG: helix-turn-helix transcriptional regulator [Candidatus Omnitrophica bacterium]|nr:helix-turn-helix transcriptional regulator [Candidatus Omnitrophota bacterium]
MTRKTTDWLWDRNIPPQEIRNILTDERHPKFTELAALLLARKNVPKEVFEDYLSRETFVRNWPRVKKRMRQDKWTEDRIIFWQAIYEKVTEIFKKKGIAVRPLKTIPPGDELFRDVGDQIKNLRKQAGLTQSGLAQKLDVSQQVISRVESGRGNVSLLTIKQIVGALGHKAMVQFAPQS